MKVLMTCENERFMIKEGDHFFIVAPSTKKISEVTEAQCRSITRQGYWGGIKEVPAEIEKQLKELIGGKK
jgi:hypothetical protein